MFLSKMFYFDILFHNKLFKITFICKTHILKRLNAILNMKRKFNTVVLMVGSLVWRLTANCKQRRQRATIQCNHYNSSHLSIVNKTKGDNLVLFIVHTHKEESPKDPKEEKLIVNFCSCRPKCSSSLIIILLFLRKRICNIYFRFIFPDWFSY